MKICIFFALFAFNSFAQNLSPAEQKVLLEENKKLKEEVKMLREEINNQQSSPQDSAKLMEGLKKGQKFQEEQLKALEELDKEE